MKRLTIATLCALLLAVLVVRASEPPFEAGYPYNFYYGSLHSHTTYSDGGHPNDSSCAAMLARSWSTPAPSSKR